MLLDRRPTTMPILFCPSGEVFSFRKTFLPSRSLTRILFKVGETFGASLSEVWVSVFFSFEAATVRGRSGEGGELG